MPWNNRLEAQIEAGIQEIPITFFDTLYAMHKPFYRAGRYYSFVLAGLAYACTVIKAEPFEIVDPVSVRIIRNISQKNKTDLSPVKIETKGMAGLLPISGWDRDDYHFQAPVKAVTETQLFGQRTWRIRATVARSLDDPGDIDLDIYVTEKVLRGEKVPEPGDDIAGGLWLQGYMWYPPTF